MSFSRNLGPTRRLALAAIASLPTEQAKNDQSAPEGTRIGHQEQIRVASEQLAPVIEDAPDGAEISGAVWGHANADGSGDFGFRVQVEGRGYTLPRVGTESDSILT